MSTAVQNLQNAFKHTMDNRPKVGGFPYLAECLRKAGVKYNIYEVDFSKRMVTYFGVNNEQYEQFYIAVEV